MHTSRRRMAGPIGHDPVCIGQNGPGPNHEPMRMPNIPAVGCGRSRTKSDSPLEARRLYPRKKNVFARDFRPGLSNDSKGHGFSRICSGRVRKKYNLIMTKAKLRLLTLLWATCIMTGAMVRGYRLGAHLQTVGVLHIAAHFGVFAVLGLLLVLSFDTPPVRLLALLSAIALGFTTELYEHLAFQSPMEFGDVAVDALGVLAGAAARVVRKPSILKEGSQGL
jgi:hypothetical protein